MSTGNGPPRRADAVSGLAGIADRLIRQSMVASLATLERDGGNPYASLIEVATLPDGRPLMLLSSLARHCRNLEADSRVALLIDQRDTSSASLASERATLMGTATRESDRSALRRFLARHPGAEAYASLGDFSLWRIDPSAVHVIAGFGRIGEIAWPSLGDADAGWPATSSDATEADIVGRLGALVPAMLDEMGLGDRITGLRITGADRLGIDLVATVGEHRSSVRLTYASRAGTTESALEMGGDLIYRWIRRVSETSSGGKRPKAKPNEGSGG
jgi:putative heme iron utilization protein